MLILGLGFVLVSWLGFRVIIRLGFWVSANFRVKVSFRVKDLGS